MESLLLLHAYRYVIHVSSTSLMLSRETFQIVTYFGCCPGDNKRNYIQFAVQQISSLRKLNIGYPLLVYLKIPYA